jgi:hypothetical protein
MREEGELSERREARGWRQEELRRRGEEALQQESEAVAVRVRNEARALRGIVEAYEEVMQRQQALVDTHREVSDNILQLTLYQTDLQRGRVSLSTGEVVDVQRALQMGWRPTTPEEEEGSDVPQYHEVDLTQEWSEPEVPMGSIRNVLSKSMESIGIVPTMGNIRSKRSMKGERAGEVSAVPSTSQGVAPVSKIFTEKSSWAELEGQPIAEVHDAIVKKLKSTPEALRVDEVEMTDEACALEFVKKRHKKVDLIRPYIQAQREVRMRMLDMAAKLRGLGSKHRRDLQREFK